MYNKMNFHSNVPSKPKSRKAALLPFQRVFQITALSLLAGISLESCGPTESAESSIQAVGEITDNMISNATQPTNTNRDFTCPVEFSSPEATVNGKVVSFTPASEPKVANWEALSQILSNIKSSASLKATVILVRRIKGSPNPTYYYLSNGTQNDTFQTWSSSKFIAFTAAAQQLRIESQGKVGLDGFVKDHKGDWVPVGDLASSITVYRDIHRDGRTYDSNNLGTFMQNISGRSHSQTLLTNWLNRGSESFKGGYNGAAGDSTQLKPIFKNQSGTVHSTKFSSAGAGANRLSTFTFAETLKRLVMHREDASTRLPSIQWADLQTLFYGSLPGQSVYFKDKGLGGMQGGASSFTVQPFGGFNSQIINQKTGGNWRHISKIGYGEDEAVYHSYTCVPKLDEAKNVVGGYEFIVSLRNKGNFANKRDSIIRKSAAAISESIISGQLGGPVK